LGNCIPPRAGQLRRRFLMVHEVGQGVSVHEGHIPTVCGGVDGSNLSCVEPFANLPHKCAPTHPVLVHHVTGSVQECEFKRANSGPPGWRVMQSPAFYELHVATIEDRMCPDHSTEVRQRCSLLHPDKFIDVRQTCSVNAWTTVVRVCIACRFV
jgi:hypothetical protein